MLGSTQVNPFPRNSPVLPGIRSDPKMPNVISMDSNQKVQHLELRLNQAEQSNRALLEEVMRIQNEMKVTVRQNEQRLEEERNLRRQMETSQQMMTSKMVETEERLRRADQGLAETKNALAQLVGHTRNVEKAVTTSQQDLLAKKDISLNKVQELRQEVGRLAQSKEQMERMVYTMRDQLQEAAARLEAQTLELNSLRNGLNVQHRLVEEQARRGNSSKDELTKQQLEARVMEHNHILIQLQNRVEHDSKAREVSEQSISGRIQDLLNLLSDQNRKREESIRALEVRTRESAQHADSERQKIVSRMDHVTDNILQEVLTRESRLKQDINERLNSIEKTVNSDQKSKLLERTLRDEIERKCQSTRKTLEDDIKALQNKIEHDNKSSDGKIRELHNGLNLLDQQMQQVRQQTDKVLAAEIKSRKLAEKDINVKIDELREKLRLGMANLTDAVGNVKKQPAPRDNNNVKLDMLKVHEISQDTAEQVRKALVHDLTQLDGRMNAVNDKMLKREKEVDARLRELAKNQMQSKPVTKNDDHPILGNEYQQKIDGLQFSQDRLKRQVDTMQNDLQRLPREVSDLDTRVDRLEKASRNQKDPNAASAADLAKLNEKADQAQTGVRKLAESIQVMKGVLNDKIKEEATIREHQTGILRTDVTKIKQQINAMYSN